MPPDPYTWSFHLEATVATAGLAAVYYLAVRRRPPRRRRIAAFGAGIGLLFATAVTPLDSLSYHLLSAHLLQNVVLAEWAPALLVLGLPPYLAARIGAYRATRTLTYPPVALTIWLATYFIWHLPWAYDTALEHPSFLLHAEHACYVAAGCVFWWPLLHDRPHAISDAARAGYLFAAFLFASPLGLLLTLLPNPVYDYYDDSSRLWGLSPITDQQIAGVTMVGEQAIVFFVAFAYFFFRFLAQEEKALPNAP